MSALRPVTLPALPPSWSEIAALKSRAKGLQKEVVALESLEKKLEGFTDEPVWNAMIPFGPLAYFPGQLIHTNDITSYEPIPSTSTSSSTSPEAITEPKRILRSSKQAKEATISKREALMKVLQGIEEDIVAKEGVAKKTPSSGLEDGWVVNENGEVLNEEGLPIFDIQEELPEEEEQVEVAPETERKKEVVEEEKPKMRYLIKKGGKVINKTLQPKATPQTASAPVLSTSIGSLSAETSTLLDQLEQEEAEEEAKKATEQVTSVNSVPLSTVEATTSSPAPAGAPTAAPSAKGKEKAVAPGKEYLPSFSAGFLSRGNKATTKSTPSPTSTPIKPTPLAAPSEPTTPKEPLHHVLPTPKSIYRPTPPPSAPSTRPSSPKPNRNVAFDLPPPSEEEKKVEKPKRAPIILPPPPTEEEKEKAKESFVRPIKEQVVERPVQSPSAPTPKNNVLSRAGKPKVPIGESKEGSPLATVGMPPRSSASSSTSRTEATPIHTISLSAANAASSAPGTISIHDFSDDDGENFEEDSDSSGFYGSDPEDDDDDEIDIDSALHNREVALEYHRQRMAVGAGAGTGPLGGHLDASAYDSWNQPDVPIEASMQGRTPGVGKSSRFRTGRLESAQMIIPSILQQEVRAPKGPTQESDDEEDGLSPEERESIRITLEQLAKANVKIDPDEIIGGPSKGDKVVVKKKDLDTAPSIEQLLGAPPPVAPAKPAAPPRGTPIAVPSNAMLKEEVVESTLSAESGPEAVQQEKPKKMSRFKARQLGLE